MYEFKVGDEGKTRNGTKFTVIASDPDFGETPLVVKIPAQHSSKRHNVVLRRLTGLASFSTGDYPLDLLPPTKTIYLNIYSNTGVASFLSKDAAIEHAQYQNRPASALRVVVIAHPVEVPQS